MKRNLIALAIIPAALYAEGYLNEQDQDQYYEGTTIPKVHVYQGYTPPPVNNNNSSAVIQSGTNINDLYLRAVDNYDFTDKD